jgi:PIN domain nuclease of toxin-antitoxin system
VSGLLLDTCATLWIAAGDPIAPAAEQALREAQQAGAALQVSAITAWEIGLLAARGRIALTMTPQAFFAAVLATPGVALAALTPGVLIDSSHLPGAPPRDPADRMVIATARAHGLAVVTRDRAILGYAEAGHVQAVAC